MKTQKKKWITVAAGAAVLLMAVLGAEWFWQMQEPLRIDILGDGRIQHVEASCISSQGCQREELKQSEIKRLARVMNGIKGEKTAAPPGGPAYGKRMVFSVENSDGRRHHMILSDQTLTVDNGVTYLLSKKDARQIERLFGEIL